MNSVLKLYFLIIICFGSQRLNSQLNFFSKGNKAFYWGINMSVNGTDFSINRKPSDQTNDTIIDVYTDNALGFNLGIISNWQINSHFDLRTVPNMSFSSKILNYTLINNSKIKNQLTTNAISIPISFRFKTDPIKDWRIFVLGGLRYDYNFVPQGLSREEPNLILMNKHNLSMEYGIGLQYFFPYFIFSPELKYSHGLFNSLKSNQSDLNNSILQSLYLRGWVFSINFEG